MTESPYQTVPDLDSNRREQFRFSPQDEKQRQICLVAGRQKLAGELINESSGGFMIALPGKSRVKADRNVELHLYDRSAPVRILWSREEDGRQIFGLERKPEHFVPRPEKKGGLILVALLVFAAFVAGYLLKKDAGIRQLMIRNNLIRPTTPR